MRVLSFILFAALAPVTVHAEQWHFEASLEGGAVYWTFINDTGEVSPLREKTNEFWITRSDDAQDLGANGACTFSNCSVTVYLDGHLPPPGALVTLTFSNQETFQFQGNGAEDALNNTATLGMGTTNNVVANVRSAAWVDVQFDGRSHRFDLTGSSAALDQINRYLQ